MLPVLDESGLPLSLFAHWRLLTGAIFVRVSDRASLKVGVLSLLRIPSCHGCLLVCESLAPAKTSWNPKPLGPATTGSSSRTSQSGAQPVGVRSSRSLHPAHGTGPNTLNWPNKVSRKKASVPQRSGLAWASFDTGLQSLPRTPLQDSKAPGPLRAQRAPSTPMACSGPRLFHRQRAGQAYQPVGLRAGLPSVAGLGPLTYSAFPTAPDAEGTTEQRLLSQFDEDFPNSESLSVNLILWSSGEAPVTQ